MQYCIGFDRTPKLAGSNPARGRNYLQNDTDIFDTDTNWYSCKLNSILNLYF